MIESSGLSTKPFQNAETAQADYWGGGGGGERALGPAGLGFRFKVSAMLKLQRGLDCLVSKENIVEEERIRQMV